MRYQITKKILISLDISNLFNTGYADIGNVPVPGRWIRAGVGLVHW
jgi:outer membrane receptor protein involved in Fe transport